jgi:RNA polymerase sigma-70 factor (ECF subfamily)
MLSFQDLYETYAKDVYHFALWLSGDRYDAEDITSEVFIRAWARNNKIRTETLKAYLLTIARNVYLEGQRKGKRQVVLKDVHPDPAPEPDQVVQSQMEISRVMGILRTLPECDRTAFVLRVQHELPYAEIARVLQLSISAAKVKVHRARKKILAIYVDKEE